MHPRIEIHIDRIVLEGFDHFNTKELHTVIQHYLTQWVQKNGIPNEVTSQMYHRKMDGGHFQLSSKTDTSMLGAKIAHGIINGINTAQ